MRLDPEYVRQVLENSKKSLSEEPWETWKEILKVRQNPFESQVLW
jgi:hypothetical protein